jgi:hypothetical protein
MLAWGTGWIYWEEREELAFISWLAHPLFESEGFGSHKGEIMRMVLATAVTLAWPLRALRISAGVSDGISPLASGSSTR